MTWWYQDEEEDWDMKFWYSEENDYENMKDKDSYMK